jgi:hypothetical protein
MHDRFYRELDEAWHGITRLAAFIGGKAVERFKADWAAYGGSAQCVGVASVKPILKRSGLTSATSSSRPHGFSRWDRWGFSGRRARAGVEGQETERLAFYLSWRAQEFGIRTRFIELAGEVNTSMPRWVVERAATALDARTGRGLKDAKALLLGIAYKRNVDDMRASPALVIWELLEARGAEVVYHDPHVPEIPRTREHMALAGRCSVPLDPATLASADMAIVITDHAAIDWRSVVAHSRLVIDTRNVTRDVAPARERVVPA